jgi:hypothetical protein
MQPQYLQQTPYSQIPQYYSQMPFQVQTPYANMPQYTTASSHIPWNNGTTIF